ncbi:MAG: divergent PAP2 family protein [Candidatus Omnitrophica bacterium]|nr:divergent PAP2 family protein [Candidatus Omnitrophota bacterium]
MTKGIISAALNNDILISTLLGWVTAQGIKIGIGTIREKQFDFRWLLGTGGMPSAHAAGVASLATAIGIEFGFDSALFALGLTFAVVTMFDAQGVRRAAGKQASILNKLISEHPENIKVQEKRLIELLGHTPIEVIAGAFVGILVALSYL